MATRTWEFERFAMAEGALAYAENALADTMGLQEKADSHNDKGERVIELYNPDNPDDGDKVVCRLTLSSSQAAKHMLTFESTHRNQTLYSDAVAGQCHYFDGKESNSLGRETR